LVSFCGHFNGPLGRPPIVRERANGSGVPSRGVVACMTNPNTETLGVEFKKEVAKMREREATDLEIQSMLEFVEQLTHWRGDVDREPLINALREAARR